MRLHLAALGLIFTWVTAGAAVSQTGPPVTVTGAPGPYGETLTIDDKGLTLKFPDDAATLRIGGRLHLDFGAASVRQAGFGEPFFDNIAVRRSWIESYLTIGKTIELALQYDLSVTTAPVNDAAIAFHAPNDVLISLGNFKEPFSQEQLQANNVTLFTERSLADAFAPARNVGAAIGVHGTNWTAVMGVFGGNINTGVELQGIASTTRLTYAPILEPDQVLHFGLAGSYRSFGRDSRAFGFSSQAEAFLFRDSFVDTDTIERASALGLIGLEAAYQYGPFWLQAEYVHATVDRFDGRPSVSFQGGYVEASVILNGFRARTYALVPRYATSYAVFSGVVVPEADRVTRGGFGVFELAARFSAVDLQSRDIRGGRSRDVTVGLNWYPDRNVRIMANYVRSHTAPSAIEGFRMIDADTFIGRFQLYW